MLSDPWLAATSALLALLYVGTPQTNGAGWPESRGCYQAVSRSLSYAVLDAEDAFQHALREHVILVHAR
jgi:hypothetical protein